MKKKPETITEATTAWRTDPEKIKIEPKESLQY